MVGRCIGIVFLAALCGCAPKADIVTSTPNREFRINQQEAALFADSSIPLDDNQVASFELLTGRTPTLWGRYVCNPYKQGAHNLTQAELPVFAKYHITPVLIIEPLQEDLGGGAAEASTEEACVVARLRELKALPGGEIFSGDVRVFLAVEMGAALSPAYLHEMIADLQHDGIVSNKAPFGVYLHGVNSAPVRGTINAAIAAGMPISAVWYARYQPDDYCGPPEYWQENNIAEFGIVNVPVEILQYAGDCHAYGSRYFQTEFDLDVIKPPVVYEQVSGTREREAS